MRRKFEFDFDQLTFQDQKAIYRHIDPETTSPNLLESATKLEELKDYYDDEENQLVYRLSYLAALLAHGIAVILQVPVKREGKAYTFEEVILRDEFELDQDFSIEWYDGLNYDGKGLISLSETIEMYRLEELALIFKKYNFLEKT